MEIHYNAFISYRHHPVDIRVATEIHRLLERFKLPKAQKKQTGGITRLFRDKDELPITNNLSSDITQALRNSEFLIVICSTHTKESLWVQREIDTFLQTHDRSRVLTVLVDGEPYDVIPECLLYEDVVDPATGETRRMALEPLSCDWRMSRRRRRREELPRLAAALLHCSYDDLRQRQKQYRMRKMIIGGGVALAASLTLAAYFLYTSITIRNANIQIQANYEQSLRNQSQYLATAARRRMADGDRMAALALLLEALPGEGQDRPYVTAAEQALTEVLGVYNLGGEIMAQGALMPDASALVTEFMLSSDCTVIYLRDSRGVVTAWDTQTLTQIGSIDGGQTLTELLGVTAQGNVLIPFRVGDNNCIQCRSPEGQLLWQADGYSDIAFQDEKKTVLLQSTDSEGNNTLLFLDALTGEAVQPPVTMPGQYGHHTFVLDRYRAGDALVLEYGDVGESIIYLLDPQTGETSVLLETRYAPDAACITDDGKLILMVSDGSGMLNGSVQDTQTSSPARSDIYCYDRASRSLLWQSEIVTYQFSGAYTLEPVPGSDSLFCQAGNTFQLISLADGSLIQVCESPAGAGAVTFLDEAVAFGVLKDGGIFTYYFADNLCQAEYYDIPGNLRQSDTGGGVYVLPLLSSQVTVFRTHYPEYLWEKPLWESGAEARTVRYIRRWENLLAFDSGQELCLFDLEKQDYLWQLPRPDYFTILDFDPEGKGLWLFEEQTHLVFCDAATGERIPYPVPLEREGKMLFVLSDMTMADGRFWYTVSCGMDVYLAALVPQTGEVTYYDLPDALDSLGGTHDRVLDVTDQAVWYLTGEGALYLLPKGEGEPVLAAEGLGRYPAFAPSASGGAALGSGNRILLLGPGGQVTETWDLGEEVAGSFYRCGEELLCLTELGHLLRFGSDGTLLSRTELMVSGHLTTSLQSSRRQPEDITWHETGDGRLIQVAFGIANIVDSSSWERCATVSCLCYCPETDSFLRRSDGQLMNQQRLGTTQLMALAEAQLGDYRLSPADREAFGLRK